MKVANHIAKMKAKHLEKIRVLTAWLNKGNKSDPRFQSFQNMKSYLEKSIKDLDELSNLMQKDLFS